jgi:beta-N-acetylhexosaminidase
MVGLPGPELDEPTAAALREIGPAGIVLFRRNLESPSQTIDLLDDVDRLLPHPILAAIDQEGGRVSRLEEWIGPTEPAATLARRGVDAVHDAARFTAGALRSLGLNLDFAPVVDLCEPGAPNGIGDRSFGCAPDETTRFAGAYLDGLQSAGVAACLKHFPGLGATVVDSHAELPVDRRSAAEIARSDLVPFRELAPRAAGVMIGHAFYPALDPDGGPASLSPAVIGGLLRGALGFRGLAISDDLEMGAVAPLDDGGRAAERAVAAGCDLVLYCADLDAARRAQERIARTASSDAAFARRVNDAIVAVAEAADRWVRSRGTIEAWDLAIAARPR